MKLRAVLAMRNFVQARSAAVDLAAVDWGQLGNWSTLVCSGYKIAARLQSGRIEGFGSDKSCWVYSITIVSQRMDQAAYTTATKSVRPSRLELAYCSRPNLILCACSIR